MSDSRSSKMNSDKQWANRAMRKARNKRNQRRTKAENQEFRRVRSEYKTAVSL